MMQGRRLAVEFSLGPALQTMRVSFSGSLVRGAAPVAEIVFAIGTGGSAKLEGKEHCAFLLGQQQQGRVGVVSFRQALSAEEGDALVAADGLVPGMYPRGPLPHNKWF